MSGQREFDILLWGVTGWTGVHLLEYFTENYAPNGGVSWGVVARSESKLKQVIEQIKAQSTKNGSDATFLDTIPKFYVSNDEKSFPEIVEIVSKSKSVGSVVGPYNKYGEVLIKACVESGTHYCDITGEVTWVRKMIDKYAKIAEDNHVFLTSFCGNDSIPSDMGAFNVVDACNKALMEKLNLSKEVFEAGVKKSFKVEGYVTKYQLYNRDVMHAGAGTIASILDIVDEVGVDGLIKSKANFLTGDDDANEADKDHNPQIWVGRQSKLKGKRTWTTHHGMAAINEKVVRRSRYLLPGKYGDQFSFHEAWTSEGPVGATLHSLGVAAAYLVIRSKGVRGLLLRNLPQQPGLMPPPKDLKTYKPGEFIEVFLCEAEYILPGTDDPIQVKARGEVHFFDEPGWPETSKTLSESCLALAFHDDEVRAECNLSGGYITPACIGNILKQRLESKGIKFTIDEINVHFKDSLT